MVCYVITMNSVLLFLSLSLSPLCLCVRKREETCGTRYVKVVVQLGELCDETEKSELKSIRRTP